jgi:hypothetical protein
LFLSKNLVDIKPSLLVPTWRNGHGGQEAIARCLDRVLVSDDILREIEFYRSWVEYPFFFDDTPIFLQLELTPRFKIYPFKFNTHWLNECDFRNIVFKVWQESMFLTERNAQHQMIWKLQVLKRLTKRWHSEKVKFNQAKMLELELILRRTYIFW